MSKKNIVLNVRQQLLQKLKALFIRHWGIKLVAFIITMVLWFLAHSHQFK